MFSNKEKRFSPEEAGLKWINQLRLHLLRGSSKLTSLIFVVVVVVVVVVHASFIDLINCSWKFLM